MTAFSRAQRIKDIEMSQIVRLTESAAEMRAKGRDVVALSTGEPDFPTPAHVVAAAHAAAQAGETRYPPTAGTPALHSAIARDVGVTAAEVIVTTGAKQALAGAMLATLNPCDEVILPMPCWASYSDIVRLAGGVPVALPCSAARGFKPAPEALEATITPRTRWVMLNSPSNPSGAVLSPAEIGALADVLRRHPQVWLLSDEIYAHLCYVPFTRFRDAAPDLASRMLTVDGVSKAYAMTGWRIGWGIGPTPLIAAMAAVQGQITSGACSVAQAAALAALTGDQTLLAERRAVLRARRDRVVAALNRLPGIDCPTPDGAFYVFPDVSEAATALGCADDQAFCARLLEDHGLVLVPGAAFGLPGHVRLSFAYGDDQIGDGLDRLSAALSPLPA